MFEIFGDFEIFEKSKMKGVWMIFMILCVCCQSVPTILSSRASMRGFEMDEVRFCFEERIVMFRRLFDLAFFS